MKLKLLVAGFILSVFFVGLVTFTTTQNVKNLKERHAYFLKNSPINSRLKMSKKERLSSGIPPNKYMENEYLLEMNPTLGRPTPEKLFALQEKMTNKNLAQRVPGDATGNAWVERGPNNVGGRTRMLLFDPNDSFKKRVFAGGVSGGLWVNNDITDANASWTRVSGIPENISASSITVDPNNSQIFYVGTGESYVGGSVNGNGLWQSLDGGVTWGKIFGGATANGEGAKLTVNAPGSIASDYTAIQASFGLPLTSITGNLVLVDDGTGLPTEGCNTLINGGAVSGNIAVIERGSCSFATKVKNAENAGAIAVLVVNNVAGAPIIMGGDDYTIYIPAIMVSQADGQTIMAQLGSTVNVTIQPDVTPSTLSFYSGGVQHINDIAIRDVGSTSEIYVAAAASSFADASPTGFMGVSAYGLYKSTDSGVSWILVDNNVPSTTHSYEINDIEIAADNSIWVATRGSIYGDGGGVILSSTDGVTFSDKHTITGGKRTQIAASSTNAGTFYVLAQGGATPVTILKTTDSFATVTTITPPADADTDIAADDFTRGQSFYDLLLEVDPVNDNIAYVGGIDLFRTSNSGTSWSQISKWSNNNALSGLNISEVHADMHALAFHPSTANVAIIGNDGGVFYARTLSGASVSTTAIASRNKDYNVTQFYSGAIGQLTTTDMLLAGAQDNGSQFVDATAGSGANSFVDVYGGDGAYEFIDKDNAYLIVSYVYNTYTLFKLPLGSGSFSIQDDQTTGAFINPTDLDDNLDILYSDGFNDPTNQISRYTDILTATPIRTNIKNGLLTEQPTAFKVSPFTTASTILFVGLKNGTLLKVTNADTSPGWFDISDSSFVGSISNINFGANEDEIIVTFHNYGVASVWFTTDGGTTWANKEGDLPDLPVKAVMMNPLNNDEVIVGTDLGVWRTQNFKTTSPNWVQSQNGMQNSKVTSFDLRTADNTVLASTYGRGLFTGAFSAGTLAINNFEKEKTSILVYPTASNGQFTITPKLNIGKSTLSIFDMRGRQVYKETHNFRQGTASKINTSLKVGVYVLKLKGDNFNFTQKIIIK